MGDGWYVGEDQDNALFLVEDKDELLHSEGYSIL